MRKKCKVCGAPLDEEKCHYCGTMSFKEKLTAEDLEKPTEEELISLLEAANALDNGSEQSEDSHPQSMITQPQPEDQQSHQMMMAPKRANSTVIAVIVATVILLLVVGGAMFIFTRLNTAMAAFGLIESSFAAMEDVDSLSADFDIEIELSAPGISTDIPITLRLYVEMLDDLNMQLDISMSIFGMLDQSTLYWRDGYMYTVENGVVSRERVDDTEQVDMDPSITDIFEPEDLRGLITSATSNRISGGGYRLELAIDEKLLGDLFREQGIIGMFDVQDELGTFDELDEFELFDLFDLMSLLDVVLEFEEMNVVVYLDSDYFISSASIDMAVAFIIDGFNISLDAYMDLTIDQIGDITVDFPAYLDDAEEAEEIVFTPIADSELLGTWENGSGFIFIWVFDEAETVEFLENGTVIITQSDGTSETVDWNPTGSGSFIADEDHFTYAIISNALTITDSFNDTWEFTRSDNGVANDIGEVDVSADDIIGTWEWDEDNDYILTFDEDGTATRGFADRQTDFEWEFTDENVITMTFGNRTEEWEAVIVNDVLTIFNLSNNNEWSYIRVD